MRHPDLRVGREIGKRCPTVFDCKSQLWFLSCLLFLLSVVLHHRVGQGSAAESFLGVLRGNLRRDVSAVIGLATISPREGRCYSTCLTQYSILSKECVTVTTILFVPSSVSKATQMLAFGAVRGTSTIWHLILPVEARLRRGKPTTHFVLKMLFPMIKRCNRSFWDRPCQNRQGATVVRLKNRDVHTCTTKAQLLFAFSGSRNAVSIKVVRRALFLHFVLHSRPAQGCVCDFE